MAVLVTTILLAAGCSATPGAATPDRQLARDLDASVTALVAASGDESSARTQERALELVASVPDARTADLVYPALERACRDGNGQDIAPLLHETMSKVRRVSSRDAERIAGRILTRCGLMEWTARHDRVGYLRTSGEGFVARSEAEIISALHEGTRKGL